MVWVVSYRGIRTILEARVSEAAVETLKQIHKNVSLVLSGIEDLSLFIISNPDIRRFCKLSPAQLMKEAKQIQDTIEMFSNLANNPDSYIFSINIYGYNGLRFETAGTSIGVGNLERVRILEETLPDDGRYVVSTTYQRHFLQYGEKYILSFYRKLRDIYDLSSRLGVLRIDIDERKINRIYRDLRLGYTGYVFITDQEGYVVSSTDTELIGKNIRNSERYRQAFQGGDGYYRNQEPGMELLVTYHTSPHRNLVLIGSVPFQELTYELKILERTLMVVFLIALCAAVLLYSFLSFRITRPLQVLADALLQIERGNFEIQVNIDRKDEIGALADGFNRMSSELKRMIQEVYVSKLARKEAELRSLYAQIHPHFLYNSLDMIYWTARLEKAEKTSIAVGALAKLFRLGLNRGKEFTTIRNELEHIRNYVLIQCMRYDHPPEVFIQVDSDLEEYYVLHFILQPIVENAFIHGIAEIEHPGRIEIRALKQDQRVVFLVKDNGIGMDNDKIVQIFRGQERQQSSYGIWNVHERIQLHHGKAFGVRIHSTPGAGTEVRIEVPFVKEEPHES